MKFVDYYSLLGISSDATTEEIEAAYKQALEIHRPGQFHSSYKQYANQFLDELELARRTLTEPTSRSRFDRQRKRKLLSPQNEDSSQEKLKRLMIATFITVVFLKVLMFSMQYFNMSTTRRLGVIAFLFTVACWVLFQRNRRRNDDMVEPLTGLTGHQSKPIIEKDMFRETDD